MDDLENRVARAEKLAMNGNYQDARRMAREILDEDPGGIVERRADDLLERTGVDNAFIYAWICAFMAVLIIIIIFVL